MIAPGQPCPECDGYGWVGSHAGQERCDRCAGRGVEPTRSMTPTRLLPMAPLSTVPPLRWAPAGPCDDSRETVRAPRGGPTFNDWHTHAEVLAVFDRAIAAEESRQ